jgi:hypothetical protein
MKKRETKMQIAIFDLDGTVIDSEHRKVALPNGDIDLAHWRENCTAEKIAQDGLLGLVYEMRALYARGINVIICTARVLSNHDYAFFANNDIPSNYILSRPEGCNTSDGILKAQQITELLERLNIPAKAVEMWDDNQSVIACMKEIGVKCHDAKLINKIIKNRH